MNLSGLKGFLIFMKELERTANRLSKSKMIENPESKHDININAGLEFDFFRHVHEVLLGKSFSGFINYHDLYLYLGRRFCLRKKEIKQLIRTMQTRGYLILRKRGVNLVIKSN